MDPNSKVALFLSEINGIIKEQDGAKMQSYLVIEPPYGQIYYEMIEELRQKFPKPAPTAAINWRVEEKALEQRAGTLIPEVSGIGDGPSWGAFTKFIAQYLAFLRDVNIENLLDTYDLLSDLIQKVSAAASSGPFGHIVIPTSIAYAKILCRLAIGLDKQPELIAHVLKVDEEGKRESLPERAADTLRPLLTHCLSDRTVVQPNTRPSGKKGAIYTLANVSLQVLFACKKISSAKNMLNNIQSFAPPITVYPASVRVKYLYYLGRFHFATSHYYHAALCLQSAFNQTPARFTSQRRSILIYLITAHICCGRYPSGMLWTLPEAKDLQPRFASILSSIRSGDFETFRRLTDLTSQTSPHLPWLLSHGLLLPLTTSGEILLFRSLVRRTFLIAGDQGDTERRRAPSLDLLYLTHLWRWLYVRSLLPYSSVPHEPLGKRNGNWHHNDASSYQPPGPDTDPPLPVFEHLTWPQNRFVCAELADLPSASSSPSDPSSPQPNPTTSNHPVLPNLLEIEALVSTLIGLGMIYGYIAHKSRRVAFQGAKRPGGVMKNGFPSVWETVRGKYVAEQGVGSGDAVPGWNKGAGVQASGPTEIRVGGTPVGM